MSKTDLFEYQGKGNPKCINSQLFFSHVVSLLVRTYPHAVKPVPCVYYRFHIIHYRLYCKPFRFV
jgi:hypothetical protein